MHQGFSALETFSNKRTQTNGQSYWSNFWFRLNEKRYFGKNLHPVCFLVLQNSLLSAPRLSIYTNGVIAANFGRKIRGVVNPTARWNPPHQLTDPIFPFTHLASARFNLNSTLKAHHNKLVPGTRLNFWHEFILCSVQIISYSKNQFERKVYCKGDLKAYSLQNTL